MDTVRIGVIGVGRMGRNHCRVYATMRGAKLVGIYDPQPEAAQAIAAMYDVPVFNQVEDLLEVVDAVSIVTPTPFHYDLVMQCLARGIHVLVEKPMTETLEQAESLVREAAMSDKVVQVGHIERFNPTYMELKKVLEEMSVLAVNFKRLSPYQTSNTDVDVVLDLMIHDIDLAHDLIGGEPQTITANGLTAFSGKADHVVTQMGFENGPIVTMTASRVTEQKVRTIEVTCREAFIEADLLNKSISVHRRSFGEYLNHNKAGVKYRQESVVERILVPGAEPLMLELAHFVESVQHKAQSSVPPQAGFFALRSAERICDDICGNLVDIPEKQAALNVEDESVTVHSV